MEKVAGNARQCWSLAVEWCAPHTECLKFTSVYPLRSASKKATVTLPVRAHLPIQLLLMYRFCISMFEMKLCPPKPF